MEGSDGGCDPPDKLEDNEEPARFAVEKVVGTRIGKGDRRFYKVRWADSWEPEENLHGCFELIQAFWDDFLRSGQGRPYQQKSKCSDSDGGSLSESSLKVLPDDFEKVDAVERTDIIHKQTSEVSERRTCEPINDGQADFHLALIPKHVDDDERVTVKAAIKSFKIRREKKDLLLKRFKQRRQSSNRNNDLDHDDEDRDYVIRDASSSPASSSDLVTKDELKTEKERRIKAKASSLRPDLELEQQVLELERVRSDGAQDECQSSAAPGSSPGMRRVHASCLPMILTQGAPRNEVLESVTLETFTEEFPERARLKQKALSHIGCTLGSVNDLNSDSLPPTDKAALGLSTLEQIASDKAHKFCSAPHNLPFDEALYRRKTREFLRKLLVAVETSMSCEVASCSNADVPSTCLDRVRPVGEPTFATDASIDGCGSLHSSLQLNQAISVLSQAQQISGNTAAAPISTVPVANGADVVVCKEPSILLAPSNVILKSQESVPRPLPSHSEDQSRQVSSNFDEIRITKSVGIMPVINLPNGKRLKLVPDGNVPENVKKYVQENYDRVVEDIAGYQGTCLENRRLLVHPDGTIKLSLVSAPKSTTGASSSSQPEVIDLVDDIDDDDNARSLAVATTSATPNLTTHAKPLLLSTHDSLPTASQSGSSRQTTGCKGCVLSTPPIAPKRVGCSITDSPQASKRLRPCSVASLVHLRDENSVTNSGGDVAVPNGSYSDRILPCVTSESASGLDLMRGRHITSAPSKTTACEDRLEIACASDAPAGMFSSLSKDLFALPVDEVVVQQPDGCSAVSQALELGVDFAISEPCVERASVCLL